MLWQWTALIIFVVGWLPSPSQAVLWISRPTDVVAFEGQIVTLSCGINYPLTANDNHHWVRLNAKSKEQAFLTEGRNIAAALNADKRQRYSVTGQASLGGYTLRISRATKSDNGLYGCLVYSRNVNKRTLSNFAKVEIVPRALPSGTPTCKIEPHHPQPGTSVQFSCSSKVDGSITTLSWSLRGEPIASNIVRSSDRSIITFRKTLGDMDNQAVYTCTEQWPAVGSQQATCSIVPLDMPVNITVIPIREQVVSGEPATFYCKAESVPPATHYMWYYEGHPVVERPDLFQIQEEGRKLTILNVIGEDFAKYTVRCTVKNVLSVKRSATAFLDVIPLSQRNATLERTKRMNQTRNQTSTNSNDVVNSHVQLLPGGMPDNTLITVLIALTAFIGTAILLLLLMVLIACLRRPIKRRMSSPGGYCDKQPLHETSIPMQKVFTVSSSPPCRKRCATKRRPVSASSYQPLQRDTSVSPSASKKPTPRRKISLPAAPFPHKSVSLYENAVSLRLSLTDGLNEDMASKTHRRGPFAPVSI